MAAIFWNTGVSGFWNTASDWSSNTVPGSNDDVTINAAGTYTVTISTFVGANSLNFDAPNATIHVNGSDFLQVGTATITGGTIDGSGSAVGEPGIIQDIPSGVWTIAASATPLILGGGLTWQVYYSTDVVNDAGTINIGDAAGLNATIENSGSFNLTTDSAGIGLNSVNVSGSLNSGIGNFANFGTLAKTGGTDTSHISASYTSSGGGSKISVSTGTLEFDGPSNTFSVGTIIEPGIIAFGAGSSNFNINPTIANFLIDGGSVSFSNTLSYGGNFSETGGSLTFSGSPTFRGTFSLSGGSVTLSSGQTLTLPAATSFSGGSITGGTVALNGTTNVNGSAVIQAAVANNGTIDVNAGLLDLGGAVSGNGTITINNGTGVEFGQASATSQKVNFASGSKATLKLDQPSAFQSAITDFQTTDTIDLAGVTANGAFYSSGNLTLYNGATPVLQLSLSTPYSRNRFGVGPDGVGGTVVTVSQPPLPPSPSDFNHDGNSDLLWQNDDGTVAVWELNGASLIGGGGPGNPGTSWQVKGSGRSGR